MAASQLSDGSWAAIGAIEVVRIPHESIVADSFGVEGSLESNIKAEFAAMLSEVASLQSALTQWNGAEVAVEIVWRAVAVTGQPHAADIRTFLVARALGSQKSDVEQSVGDVVELFLGTLAAGGFDYATLGDDAIPDVYADEVPERIVAIHRRARVLSLRNQAMAEAFVYDLLPVETVGMSRLFDGLTRTPGAFVSVQLGVTRFSEAEREFVDANALSLGALERGINDPGMGGISFSIARRPASTYSYYSDRSQAPMFTYNLLVGGDEQAVRVLASRLSGVLEANAQAPVDLVRVPLDVTAVAIGTDLTALPWRVSEIVETAGAATIWPQHWPAAARRLPNLLTADEASQVFRLPYGNRRIGAGFQVNRTERSSRNYSPGVVGGADLNAGFIGSPDLGVTIGFDLRDLTKHMFVAGTPGSGKTTFNVGMLDTLWREHNIPFLVIEPAKNEYRAMVETIPDLQVFTPGKSWLSPLVMNPFRPPAGVRLEAHKSVLKTAFAAALTMTSPLDRLFENALEQLYADFGWLDSDSLAAGHPVPAVRDFVAAFEATFERVGYTGDAANIGRAGLVRLSGMVNAFDTHQSVPIEDLMTRPTVIELSAIENAGEKTLYIALILLQLLSFHNANTVGDGRLRQALLIEEAHVLFEVNDSGQDGSASPAAIAQGLLKRMLAEIRSYGVGVIVADQSPRKVTGDVIALTNVKMTFRLVEAEDREIVGNSTNMTPEQVKRLAGLRTGEAFLFHDRLAEPEEIVTVDHRAISGTATTISDEDVAARSTYYQTRPELLRPFPECADVGAWDPQLQEVARQLARRVFIDEVGVGGADMVAAKRSYQRLARSAAQLDSRYPTIEQPLLGMIQVYFLRFLKYETSLKFSDGFLRRTLAASRPKNEESR